MRDGSLIIEFEQGQIVGLRQNPGLDQSYERLFRRAHRSVKSSATVDAGINLVVFGVLWLEARCNLLLRRALLLEVRERSFAEALWHRVQRAALLDKIELLFALEFNYLREWHPKLKPQVRSLLELRNRLVHFKESDTPISGPLGSLTELLKVMQSTDDPGLIRELKRPAILKHAQTVVVLSQWLTRFEKIHSKRRGVIITKKRSPRMKTAN